MRRLSRLMVALLLYLLLPLCLAAQISQSPNPDTSEEAVVFDRIDNLIRFEEDGTGSRETSAVIHIQSEAGVQELGQLVLGYTSATENLEIKYVRVRKPDGQVIETPASAAQDFAPEVLRETPSYSDFRERHISVVGIRPGDVLEYDTVIHVTTPLAAHEFWFEHSFAKDVVVHEQRLEVDVPKARSIKLKSPDRKYEMRESGERRIYTWIIPNLVPDRKHNRNDEVDESDFTPDVQLSTFSDWQQVSEWYAKLQGDRVVIDESVKKKADDLVHGATSPADRTRRLYDYVARNIRYVSISFGVGRLQPHAASEVLHNGYGDCKDKHTLLQALLRAEDIQSYPILINSFREIDPDIPSPGQFDHEITAVELGGELTWLDTTAEVAPYGLIMYQLRDKQALLASTGKLGGLHRTPADAPLRNQVVMKLDGRFSEAGAFDTKVSVSAQGDSDLALRAAFRSLPQSRWQDVLKAMSAMWGLEGDVSDVHIDSLEDTSKPFRLEYRYHKNNYFAVPNAGVSFRILPPMGMVRPPAANLKKALEPLRVGPAKEEIYEAHIEVPANYQILVPSSVTISRDYGAYSISYGLTKNVLDAERRVTLRVNELPASRRNDYESFRNVASSAMEQPLTANISPASAAALAALAKADGSAEDLQKAADSALQQRDFTSAADLLKRALAKDSNLKDGWDNLGRADASLGQHDDAIRAFRKQIELDSFHKSANQDLASELQQQGKFDEAIAAYRKQLEITPFNKSSHKDVGLLLAQMNRDAEAKTELEAADSLPPDDPEVKIALARVYDRSGNAEKAQSLMKSVTGSAGGPGADIYVSALRDDLDPSQTLRDAQKTLDDIGDQFDSGEFNHLSPSAFRYMDLVALAWARIGWAKFLQGENLEAIRFLEASWLLSQSGTVENRLGRVLEKEGQHDGARHAFAEAVAAGGGDLQASREQLLKLSANAALAEKSIVDANGKLSHSRTVRLQALAGSSGAAHFALVFDASNKPNHAEWLDGDADLRSAGDKLREVEYPVKFPDASSIKIIRKATLSCDTAGCTVMLIPLEGLQPGTPTVTPASAAKR